MENVNIIVIEGIFIKGEVLNVLTLDITKGFEIKKNLKEQFIDNDKVIGLIDVSMNFMHIPTILFSKLATKDSLIKDVAELLEMSRGRYFTITVRQAIKEGET